MKAILWANVQALMHHHYKKENLTRLAADTGIGPGTASRIKAQNTSVGLDVLEKIAGKFNIQPWQLLVDNFDPVSPPALAADNATLELVSQLIDKMRAKTDKTNEKNN